MQKQLLGIIGGMGPAAGVLLQQLIIDFTAAKFDQDHVPVLCYTATDIPDRSHSLLHDGGVSYAEAVIKVGKVLVSAGATLLVMPCNSAYARYELIQSQLPIPIFHMPLTTVEKLKGIGAYGSDIVSVLGTDGLMQSGLYQSLLDQAGVPYMMPDSQMQSRIMAIIRDIKAGKDCRNRLQNELKLLHSKGVAKAVLGCTELSLLHQDALMVKEIDIVDPLRITALQLARPKKQVMYTTAKS